MAAPETSAYEFQSYCIIEMLEKLLVKFIDERCRPSLAQLKEAVRRRGAGSA